MDAHPGCTGIEQSFYALRRPSVCPVGIYTGFHCQHERTSASGIVHVHVCSALDQQFHDARPCFPRGYMKRGAFLRDIEETVPSVTSINPYTKIEQKPHTFRISRPGELGKKCSALSQKSSPPLRMGSRKRLCGGLILQRACGDQPFHTFEP